MAVVTFDFDDTLTLTQWDNEDECFKFIGPNMHTCIALKKHINMGDEVHIVTSRTGPDMDREGHIHMNGQPSVLSFLSGHLNDVRDKIAGVHFTSGALKTQKLAELKASRHFDDDYCELEALPEGCVGVLVSTLHGLA